LGGDPGGADALERLKVVACCRGTEDRAHRPSGPARGRCPRFLPHRRAFIQVSGMVDATGTQRSGASDATARPVAAAPDPVL